MYKFVHFMYYYSLKDSSGFTHSIDNCLLNYYLYVSVPFVLEKLKEMGSKRDTYWERLNCSACPKWSFYQNHIHYDDGIYLKVGHYSDYDKVKKMYRLLPMFSLEVNPNKHYKKDSFQEILDFIKQYCTSGELTRYDYAIDIPLKPDMVKVFKTRKETGHYKNTRFFGQRNTNGYCRIYDKAKELKLDMDLTRVEHIINTRQRLSLEKFSYLVADEKTDITELTPSNQALVMMALQINALGGDYSDALAVLDRRARYKIEFYLTGGYKEYEYDDSIRTALLDKMSDLFFLEEVKLIETDADGFLHYDGENPFD